MSENVQNILQSDKIHLVSHEKQESGINSSENQERYLPGRCTFTIICDINDATKKMNWRLQIYKITRLI